MNRYAYDNLDPTLTPAEREAALKRRLSGPGTRRKNPERYDRLSEARKQKMADA